MCPRFFFLLLCACALETVWTARYSSVGFQSENAIRDIQEVLRNGLLLNETKGEATGCKCIGYNCGCCLDLDIPEIKLKDNCCVNVSYLPNDIGIQVTFSIDDRVYLNSTISVRNPPPLCFAIPYLKDVVSVCIDFYHLDVNKQMLSGCIKMELRLAYVIHEDVDFGCFQIPLLNRRTFKDAEYLVEFIRAARENAPNVFVNRK